MTTEMAQGVSFMCDRDGVPRLWLRDDIGLQRLHDSHATFIGLLDASSHRKGLSFLSQIRQGQPVVDWELCFNIENKLRPLNVAGLSTGSDALIVAAKDRTALRTLCEELSGNSIDYGPAFKAMLAACSNTALATLDDDVYTDFMRMYNDFSRLQRELARQNVKLQRVSEEKDRLLNMAAHDLRNPLNVISLIASGVIQRAATRLTDDDIKSLDNIVEAASGMSDLINELLDSARLRPSSPELKWISVDMPRLVQERVDLIKPLAEAKSIGLRIDVAEGVEPLNCDKGRIQQVIDNLLGNAIKFSPRDSEVSIRIETTDKGCLLTVSDQGVGIPEADQLQIFQPFVRGTGQAAKAEAGHGLGLAICHSIVEAHGGHIWAENNPDGGASLRLLLPLSSGSMIN